MFKYILAATFSWVVAAMAAPTATDSADILRGYRSAGLCIRGDQSPIEWCTAFRIVMGAGTTNESSAFLLGLYFGFSFNSETAAENVAASQRDLVEVARCALIARLEYEKLKKIMAATDVDVARILNISPNKLLAWKARAETEDRDRSVTAGLNL